METVLLFSIAVYVSAFTTSNVLAKKLQELQVTSHYVSLTGDLDVHYNFSEIQWDQWDDDSQELLAHAHMMNVVTNDTLASVQLLLTSLAGKMTFRCGTILHAGKFLVRVDLKPKNSNNASSVTIASHTIDIWWPSFTITVPMLLETYTTDVLVTLQSTGIACYPKEPRFKTWLELAYYGRNESAVHEPTRQHIWDTTEFYRITALDVNIPCSYFDQAGLYRVILRSSLDTNTTITTSDPIRVMWSEEYHIEVPTPSVFPCTRGVALFYNHPKCILPKDRLRVYGRKRALAASAASPPVFQYLSERRVERGASSVTFPCHVFDQAYVEYCFKYVSVARRGAVSEVYSTCISAHDTPVDGNWGTWSSWSSCVVTCGTGTRIRHRVCDNPKPANGGLFCEGEATAAEKCTLTKCPDRMTTQSPIDTYRMKDQCRCGCTLNISESVYIATSGHYCTEVSTWLFKAPVATVLNFTFLHFDLNDSTECLQVRDGHLESAQLLLHETSRKIPRPVITTSNAALLRYHGQGSDGMGTGFVARVDIRYSNSTSGPMTLDALQGYPLLGSPVHWAATVFCVILMVFSLALAMHHFVQNRKRQQPPQSPFGSTPCSLHEGYHPFQPVTSTTSISDISLRGRHLHTRRHYKKKRRGFAHAKKSAAPSSNDSQLSSHVSECGASPEDFLRDSRIFDSSPSSSSSECSPAMERRKSFRVAVTATSTTTTVCKPPLQGSTTVPTKDGKFVLKKSPLTAGAPRKLPVATVSPQPARILVPKGEPPIEDIKPKWTSDDAGSRHGASTDHSKLKSPETSTASGGSARESEAEASQTSKFKTTPPEESVHTETRLHDRVPSTTEVRTSPRGTVPLRLRPGRSGHTDDRRMMASLSEFSLSGTDAEFEYDYYDYGVHHFPGSYFSQYPDALSWLPPFLPVQPPFDETDYPLSDFSRQSDSSRSAVGLPPSNLRLQESSADSLSTTAAVATTPVVTPTVAGKTPIQSPNAEPDRDQFGVPSPNLSPNK